VQYDDLSKEYLLKIIELCKENDMELVLVNTGYDSGSTAKFFADSVYDIAEQYGLAYLDFTQMELINFQTDLHSTGRNTHVNFSGAEKLTKYVADYLSENYLLSDHRNDENYSRWWKDYQEFISSKAEYLQGQTDIAHYLMFLADDDYQTIIEVKDASILSEDRNQAMLENLGIDFEDMGNCNLLVVDNGTETVSYVNNQYDKNAVLDTCIGEISAYYNDALPGYEMYLNGEQLYTADDEEVDGERMRITVIREATGEVVDVKSF
jgi:hypothetical protein